MVQRAWRAVVAPAVLAALVVALLGLAPSALAHEPEAAPLDAWGTDPNALSGTIDEVCGPAPSHDAAAARPGRVALIEWLDGAFPEVEGFAGFACREIHNPRGSCPGRVQPASSTCWSTHAGGRAIDVMVGGAGNQEGYPVGGELGDRIVNTLLATRDGIDNQLARAMGIQQILWNGACWSSRTHGDRGITDVSQLGSDCVDLHDNHVHITLSEAGANGLTSFYNGGVVLPADALAAGGFQPVPPTTVRDQWLVGHDPAAGELVLRALADDGAFAGDEVRHDVDDAFTTVAFPDVAGNGDHEVLLYDAASGSHLLREIRDDGELGSAIGSTVSLEPGWTLLATPDVDGDGDDELFAYSADLGTWALYELASTGDLGTQVQADDVALDVFFSAVATPDLDGDGDDELVLYRRHDGVHEVWDFTLPSPEATDAAAPVESEAEADGAVSVGWHGTDMDGDDDGTVDSGVDLDPLSAAVVDRMARAEAAASLDEAAVVDDAGGDMESAADDGGADGEGVVVGDAADLTARAAALGAGVAALGSIDLDLDGRDELALVRGFEDGACLAIRRGVRVPDPAVDGEEPADGAEEPAEEVVADETGVVPTEVPACSTAVSTGAGAAQDGDGADGTELLTDGLDAATWLLEAPGAAEASWATVGIVAIGDARPVDTADVDG